ncbi:hypothetical protein OROHE_013278 [Orobanche hederae]
MACAAAFKVKPRFSHTPKPSSRQPTFHLGCVTYGTSNRVSESRVQSKRLSFSLADGEIKLPDPHATRRESIGFAESEKSRRWGGRAVIRCAADGVEGRLFVGRRESGFMAAERFKVVALVAAVMCLCNADRVVMSVAIVPLAAKHGWSSSFLGIVQ